MKANPNLVAVQRADKTGKVVTRHVLADPKQASARLAMPAPALGTEPKKKPSERNLKVRPSQLKSVLHSFKSGLYRSDEKIIPMIERNTAIHKGTPYSFTASEVELYDVLSTVEHVGNAVKMLSEGVRTAEEARQYLMGADAEELIIDRSAMTQKLLERNVSAVDYMNFYETIPVSQRGSEHIIDAIAFSASSLNKGSNMHVRHSILTGDISYDDIRYIGVGSLSSHTRLWDIQMNLQKVHAGKADYSVHDLKDLVKRASAEKLNQPAFSYVVEVFDHDSEAVLTKIKDLNELGATYHRYRYSPQSTNCSDRFAERALYASLLKEGLTDNYLRDPDFSDAFFDSDVPVEIAINAINNGGGVREAQAVHEDGIHTKLADGWL